MAPQSSLPLLPAQGHSMTLWTDIPRSNDSRRLNGIWTTSAVIEFPKAECSTPACSVGHGCPNPPEYCAGTCAIPICSGKSTRTGSQTILKVKIYHEIKKVRRERINSQVGLLGPFWFTYVTSRNGLCWWLNYHLVEGVIYQYKL